MFGKRVPELLKDLFPNNGGPASLGFGVKSPKNLFNDIPGARGATGLAAGLGIGAAGAGINKFKNMQKAFRKTGDDDNRTFRQRLKDASKAGMKSPSLIKSSLGGAFSGAKSGLGGAKISDIAKNEASKNKKKQQDYKEGVTFGDKISNKFNEVFGIDDEKTKNKYRTLKEGEQIYNKYVDHDTGELDIDGLYKNANFRRTAKKLSAAKKAKAEADAAVVAADARYSEAARTGNAEAIERTKKERAAAIKAANLAKTRLENVEGEHKENRILYKDDAKKEEAYQAYKFALESGAVDTTLNRRTSTLGNMPRWQFGERQAQNVQDYNMDMIARYYDPKEYFEGLSRDYSSEASSGQMSDQDRQMFEDYWSSMEEAYKRAGYEKDVNGNWTMKVQTKLSSPVLDPADFASYDTTIRNAADPNVLFDNMKVDLATVIENGKLDNNYKQSFDKTWSNLEAALQRAGYEKGNDGRWRIPTYGPPRPTSVPEPNINIALQNVDSTISSLNDPNQYMEDLGREVRRKMEELANIASPTEESLNQMSQYRQLLQKMTEGLKRAGYKKNEVTGKWEKSVENTNTPTPNTSSDDAREYDNDNEFGE